MKRHVLALLTAATLSTCALSGGASSEAVQLKNEDLPTMVLHGERPVFGPGTKLWAIDFWASWCEPCRESIPHYNKLAAKYADRGVRFIAISEDETVEDAREFLKKTPIDFPVLWDQGRSLARKLKMDAIPMLYFVDGSGNVLAVEKGFTKKSKQGFEGRLEAHLKKLTSPPVAPRKTR